MIVSLGQGVPMYQRMPFKRPRNAGFYKPKLVRGAFYSTGLNPFVSTTLPMAAFRPGLPRMPRLVRPGYVTGGGGPNTHAAIPTRQGPRPDVATMPAPVQGSLGFLPRATGPASPWMNPVNGAFGAEAPMAPAVTAPAPQVPAAMPMQRARYMSPYDSRNPFPARTMRTSVMPYVETTAGGIRQGVAMAAQTVNRSRWGTYNDRNAIPGTIDPRLAY